MNENSNSETQKIGEKPSRTTSSKPITVWIPDFASLTTFPDDRKHPNPPLSHYDVHIPPTQILDLALRGWEIRINSPKGLAWLTNEQKKIENKVPIVVMYGEYSEGKSSIVNGLFKMNYPTSALPSTLGFCFMISDTFIVMDVEGCGAPVSTDVTRSSQQLQERKVQEILLRSIAVHMADVFFFVTSRLSGTDQRQIDSLPKRPNAAIYIIHNLKDITNPFDGQFFKYIKELVYELYQGSSISVWDSSLNDMNRINSSEQLKVLEKLLQPGFLKSAKQAPVIRVSSPGELRHIFFLNNNYCKDYNAISYSLLHKELEMNKTQTITPYPFQKLQEIMTNEINQLVTITPASPKSQAAQPKQQPPKQNKDSGCIKVLHIQAQSPEGVWTLNKVAHEVLLPAVAQQFVPQHAVCFVTLGRKSSNKAPKLLKCKLDVPGCSIKDVQVDQTSNQTIRVVVNRPSKTASEEDEEETQFLQGLLLGDQIRYGTSPNMEIELSDSQGLGLSSYCADRAIYYVRDGVLIILICDFNTDLSVFPVQYLRDAKCVNQLWETRRLEMIVQKSDVDMVYQ